MKKTLLADIVFFFLVVGIAQASTIRIVSDEETGYQDGPHGNNFEPAVAAWTPEEWPNLNIPEANWIWKKDKVSSQEAVSGSYAYFERAFQIPECATNIRGTITVTAGSSYSFWINDGQRYNDANILSAETYDISGYLQTREMNILHFIVNTYPTENGTPETNPAGLIFSSEISYDGCEAPKSNIIQFDVMEGINKYIGMVGKLFY